jgi:hypothetical protein
MIHNRSKPKEHRLPILAGSVLAWLTVLGATGLMTLTEAQIVLPPAQTTEPAEEAPLPHPTAPQLAAPLPRAGLPFQTDPAAPTTPMSELIGEAELAPPIPIERLAPVWPYYLGAALIALVSLIALLLWLRKKARIAKPVPVIPADIRALEELETLRDLIHKAQARDYAYRVSDILRGYIEERFAIRAMRCTTREFLGQMSRPDSTLPKNQSAPLVQFIQYCDLAKYARQALLISELENMHQIAVHFIQETRPSLMSQTPIVK